MTVIILSSVLFARDLTMESNCSSGQISLKLRSPSRNRSRNTNKTRRDGKEEEEEEGDISTLYSYGLNWSSSC